MRLPRSRRVAAPSLRRTWSTTVVRLLVLLLGVGVAALAAMHVQHDAYERTTVRLRHKLDALVAIDLLMTEAAEPAATLLYGYGGEAAVPRALAAFEVSTRKVDEAFQVAGDRMTTAAEREALAAARTAWGTLSASSLSAPSLRAGGAVEPAAVQEEGLHGTTTLEPYTQMVGQLARVRAGGLEELDARTAGVERSQRLIVPGVTSTLVVAGAMGWRAVRRISRQVVVPLVELGRAAAAMGEDGGAGRVELGPDAAAELRALAATLHETTLTVRAHTGELRTQARTDALTGLANRAAFTDHLDARIDDASARLAVLFVDLDDFKVVNDSLGHAAGDELLRAVAGRLRGSTGDCELVARLGGDEFAVVLDCAGDVATAGRVAERIVAVLADPVRVAGERVRVGCSVGVAVAGPGELADELLRDADFAMYTAKGRGKNRYDVFAPTMHTAVVARTELKRDLAGAVRSDQLRLHYQPVVDLHTGETIAYESLVRWAHPERGLLAPQEFVGLAEDTGDIVEIGAWVLDRACGDLDRLRRATPGGALLRVGVNVSAPQLAVPSFAAAVAATLERHGVAPASLVIEVTEAVAITETGLATAALAELRDMGVHVALDDFGSGFSSLRYLHDLPVDIIKIDRSFVATRDAKTDSMLEAIVALGHRLGLEVVAEGIEEPDQPQRLRGLGRPLAGQGFLFARPTPIEEVEAAPRRLPVGT